MSLEKAQLEKPSDLENQPDAGVEAREKIGKLDGETVRLSDEAKKVEGGSSRLRMLLEGTGRLLRDAVLPATGIAMATHGMGGEAVVLALVGSFAANALVRDASAGFKQIYAAIKGDHPPKFNLDEKSALGMHMSMEEEIEFKSRWDNGGITPEPSRMTPRPRMTPGPRIER